MRGESGNIGAALAQRRHRDSQHVQAEKKIFAESAGCDGFREIGIGERHQARVHAQRLRAAQPLEGALFEHAQELGLHAGRERGHFVEDDRAALRHFEAAGLARHRAGESAAFVAEKFGFDELGRKAGAINFQKGRVAARAVLVNPARELIFARTAFAGDEQRGGRLGELCGELENATRGGIGGDPGNVRAAVSRRAVVVSRVAASSCRHRSVRHCFDAMRRLAASPWDSGGRVGAGKSMRSALRHSRSRS